MKFDIQIETSVDLPEKSEREGKWSSSLKIMKKGDSFFIPDSSVYAGLSGSCQNISASENLRFRVLKRTEKRVQVDSEGEAILEDGKQVLRDVKGVRVWCLGDRETAIKDKTYTPRKVTAKPKGGK